jgi:chromosome segregation ATPase
MLISVRLNRWLTLVVAGLLLGPFAQAQDLAALARKEKERRAKVTAPVKVLTEEDGKEATAKGAGSVTSIEPTVATANAAGSGTVTSDPEAQRAAWKARMDNAKAAVTAAENTLAQMEKDLNALRSDMTPVSAADAMDPMRLQKRDQLIVKLNKDIETQKAAVSAAKKGVTEVEDAARKGGVPAGWLR